MLGFLSFPVTAANADPGIFKGVFYGFAFSKAENPLFVCGLLFPRAFWLTVSCGIETPIELPWRSLEEFGRTDSVSIPRPT